MKVQVRGYLKKNGTFVNGFTCERRLPKHNKYRVSGNSTVGFRIAIPSEAYHAAEQPAEYTCAAMQDGTLVYQPVRP